MKSNHYWPTSIYAGIITDLTISSPTSDKSLTRIYHNSTMKTTKGSKTSTTEIEKRLHKTCDQMSLIHSNIRGLQIRHKRAALNPNSHSAHSLRLKLEVLQSVYNMYYTYASRQAKHLIVCSTQNDS